jgi:hypothetical protein
LPRDVPGTRLRLLPVQDDDRDLPLAGVRLVDSEVRERGLLGLPDASPFLA